MLGDSNVMTNIAVKDMAESKKFYGETLGLTELEDHDFGTMYGSGPGRGRLFVYQAPTAGSSKSTIATWEVSDIKKVASQLEATGAKFEHYEYPGAEHDGVIHIMGGMKAAWFRDPSGNILGLTEAA